LESLNAMKTPSYRLHKATGQAVVTLNGRDVYLGKHGTPESKSEYDRLLAEWLAAGRTSVPRRGKTPADFSVTELVDQYQAFADGYYIKNGKPTKEVTTIAYALGHVLPLYRHTPAARFGPLALKTVRREMIAAKLCRSEVNRRVRIIIRAFKWAVENELIPPEVHQALAAVAGLRQGRSEAPEAPPVKPVAVELVKATLPHVSRQIKAMILMQYWTGMRPGEVCAMRTCDVNQTGDVWTYRPESHKTEHHGKARSIFIGPKAIAVLRPWLRPDEPKAYLFSPKQATAERLAKRREGRATPLYPSHVTHMVKKRKKKSRRSPGECYSADSYRKAIEYATQKGELESWHPNQLRHLAATRLRRKLGLDAARTVLGHSSPRVTEIYAEKDMAGARKAMSRLG
jgi:integrase